MDEERDVGAGSAARRGGATRGFLFADLRGYTSFTEQRGAAAAAELLERYRTLVRSALAEHDGAEIRTEGDGFYVVFFSVSDALACGLAIVASAENESAPPVPPIRVGVGIHAGETVATPEGYVGQPVNIAARLCALAPAGEVFVSDTVRALTQNIHRVRFVARGQRRLKGIAEPVRVYAAQYSTDQATGRRLSWLGRRGILVGLPLIALACAFMIWLALRPTVPAGEARIGLSLPLTGDLAPLAESLRLAVELAVADAIEAGRLGDLQLTLVARDDGGGEFGEDPDRAEADAAAFVADPAVIAMIGPWSSDAAAEQIPITNEAGLLHCSPTNTDPRLTKPRAGALDLRSAYPTRINYVRLPAAADIEGAAAASFAMHDLRSDHALVIDDSQAVGRFVADGFQREFEALGGRVVRRALNPSADPMDVLAPLESATDGPTLVFFGGFTNTGAPELRLAMVDAGYAEIPFLGWDGLWGASGAEEGSFINLTGPAAMGSYVSHPTVGTVRADFEQRYRVAHGEPPDASLYEYAAASYACAEIIVASMTAALSAGAEPDSMREAVRAFAANPANRFETVVGSVGFDPNGDSLRQVVSFHRVEPDAADGAGDWVLVKQQDFGPAP